MARADTPVVRLVELTKRYGNLTALDRFTLDIAEGEIVGLLGPNGAGKTTTLRTLLGLLKPSGGKAEIFGIDAWADPVDAHRHLAFIPGEFNVWPQLSGGQILDLLGTTDRTLSQHNVPVEEVRASGLLKDRILLHHSTASQHDDITLLQKATQDWQSYAAKWGEYAERNGGEPVQPILVVQTKDRVSEKDLATAIHAVSDSVAGELPPAAFAHSFDTGADMHIDGRVLRYLAPSRISTGSFRYGSSPARAAR